MPAHIQRIRRPHQDDIRQKIRASAIIRRLWMHVQGEIELTQTQVASARILLNKVVADAPQEVRVANPDGSALGSPVDSLDMARRTALLLAIGERLANGQLLSADLMPRLPEKVIEPEDPHAD